MNKILWLMLSGACLLSCNNTGEKKEKVSAPIGCFSTKTSDKDWYSSGKKAPKFKGLEGVDFKISSSSPEAQEYFNQGLMLSYGFNHAEAARS
ncbi:MAG TPA: hypothetical protein PKW54_05340, partial [Ferruginibacter sp.]|nr:hypothetical protein [Ferruginibacter sp.]